MNQHLRFSIFSVFLLTNILGCPSEPATEESTPETTQDSGTIQSPPKVDAGNTSETIVTDAGSDESNSPSDAGQPNTTPQTDAGQPPMVEPFTLTPGENELTWQQMVNGSMATRNFIVNTPPDFDATQNYPVVFVFHGNAGGNPTATPHQGLVSATNEMVQDKEFIAVMPQGYDNCWQLGPENSNATTQDEMDFVAMIISRLKATPGVHTELFYAMGSSNGAALSHHLAVNTTYFKGIATLVSGLDEGAGPTSSTPKVSVLQLMNRKDNLIPYEGGAAPTGHTYMSAEDSAHAWAVHNGCDETPTIEESAESVNGVPNKRVLTYNNCDNGNNVMHIGVLPVPWSEDCEGPPPQQGNACGGKHTVDNSYFAPQSSWEFMWEFLSE
jgi:poly(3-hydroxybutyrate) depolymerase